MLTSIYYTCMRIRSNTDPMRIRSDSDVHFHPIWIQCGCFKIMCIIPLVLWELLHNEDLAVGLLRHHLLRNIRRRRRHRWCVPILPGTVRNKAHTTISLTSLMHVSRIVHTTRCSHHVYKLFDSKERKFLLGFSKLSNFHVEKYFYRTNHNEN